MKTYSTKKVAELVGISRVTLQRWLVSGKLADPERFNAGGVDVRIWNDDDIKRVRQFKQLHYRKGRGRKKTSRI
jgi:predicted site-specific integrase-resolvase